MQELDMSIKYRNGEEEKSVKYQKTNTVGCKLNRAFKQHG